MRGGVPPLYYAPASAAKDRPGVSSCCSSCPPTADAAQLCRALWHRCTNLTMPKHAVEQASQGTASIHFFPFFLPGQLLMYGSHINVQYMVLCAGLSCSSVAHLLLQLNLAQHLLLHQHSSVYSLLQGLALQ